MNNAFQELYKAVINDRKYSEWSQQKTLAQRAQFLLGEIEELKEAIITENPKNVKEELGDVIWLAMTMVALAEEKGLFTADEVFNSTLSKIKERKPFIFTGEYVSLEEEAKQWKETKLREKK